MMVKGESSPVFVPHCKRQFFCVAHSTVTTMLSLGRPSVWRRKRSFLIGMRCSKSMMIDSIVSVLLRRVDEEHHDRSAEQKSVQSKKSLPFVCLTFEANQHSSDLKAQLIVLCCGQYEAESCSSFLDARHRSSI